MDWDKSEFLAASTGSGSNPFNSSVDPGEMMKAMKDLAKKMESVPNRIVTTTSLFAKVKEAADHDSPVQSNPVGHLPHVMSGIPVDAFDTVEECLDRMLELQGNSRPSLVLAEPIPAELLMHPYLVGVRRQECPGLLGPMQWKGIGPWQQCD